MVGKGPPRMEKTHTHTHAASGRGRWEKANRRAKRLQPWDGALLKSCVTFMWARATALFSKGLFAPPRPLPLPRFSIFFFFFVSKKKKTIKTQHRPDEKSHEGPDRSLLVLDSKAPSYAKRSLQAAAASRVPQYLCRSRLGIK